MVIQMNLKNYLGSFDSEKMPATSEEYNKLIEISKNFYIEDNGFEMWIDNGFMIFPPEVLKNSILSINIIEYDKDDEQTSDENKV